MASNELVSLSINSPTQAASSGLVNAFSTTWSLVSSFMSILLGFKFFPSKSSLLEASIIPVLSRRITSPVFSILVSLNKLDRFDISMSIPATPI